MILLNFDAMDVINKKKTSKKAIAMIIGSIALLLITLTTSAYFLYILPQQKADLIALEQRKLDIEEKEKLAILAIATEKHNAALEADKAKNKQEKELKQAELIRELESDCLKQVSDLRLHASNIEGGSYNTEKGYCEVIYSTKDGIERGNIKDMYSLPSAIIGISVLEDDGSLPRKEDSFYTRYKDPVEFQGKVSETCEQIVVTATSSKTEKPDKHTLTKYQPGDTNFVYHASQALNNLHQGINIYEFTALCQGKYVSTTTAVWLEGPGSSLSYAPNKYDENVKTLQANLIFWGANIVEDGYFGDQTLAAVKDFQKKNGLVVDGIVGPKTWAALTTLLN